MSVQTNGSILPSDDALRSLSETNTFLVIASYPETAAHAKKVIEKCNEFGVRWYLNTAGGDRELWFDLGDPRFINTTDPKELRERYNKCWNPGVFLFDNQIYLCIAQGYCHFVTGIAKPEPGDTFDLRQPKTAESREELYKILSQQPSEAGYISHCMRCKSVINPSPYAKK
jgi:hypothetical protein